LKQDDGSYEVYIRNGSEKAGLEAVSWAQEAEMRGAGEILINAIACDGTMEGYDLDLIRAVSDAVDIPVIAAGGAGKPEDFPPAVLTGHASAVAAGSIYHYTKTTPDMVKQAMQSEGIPVRL
jgi:cyclase